MDPISDKIVRAGLTRLESLKAEEIRISKAEKAVPPGILLGNWVNVNPASRGLVKINLAIVSDKFVVHVTGVRWEAPHTQPTLIPTFPSRSAPCFRPRSRTLS